MKRIYLDYAASTPVDPRVRATMEPYFGEKFGNPGSLHSFGQEAIAAIDRAREELASAVGAEFREIIFTGSATEANNLALWGTYRAAQSVHKAGRPLRIVTTAIEHESVLESARELEKEGCEVIILPANAEGMVDLARLRGSLTPETFLVSVMYANNEIGTIEPISGIAEIIKEFRMKNKELGERGRSSSILNPQFYPLLHADAVQAFQFLDCTAPATGADLMTISAHKIYGPKGVGALVVRGLNSRPSILNPIIVGGGQEFGLRSGTPAAPLIAGFGKAVTLFGGSAAREKEAARVRALADYFRTSLEKIAPGILRNGPRDSSCALPNIVNVSFPGKAADFLLSAFDLRGLAVGTGSACASRSAEPSHVLRAIGCSDERARGSIRFSFGRPTTKREIDRALRVIRMAVK